MRSGFAPCASSFASTIALTMAMAVTSNAGTAVQTISSPVCPWIGGPSVSSSGFARNFQTAKTLTAATIEKTKTQIPVTNQKTKSMRPASREAELGSQLGTSATTEATAPAKTPITISWTIEPLRTDAASLLQGGGWGVACDAPKRTAGPARRPSRTAPVFAVLLRGTPPAHQRRLNGTRSWNLPDRGWRNPHIRRQRDVELGGRRCRRLDPHGRRARQRPALAALLAVLGGARLLDSASYDVCRRGTAADLLGFVFRRGNLRVPPGLVVRPLRGPAEHPLDPAAQPACREALVDLAVRLRLRRFLPVVVGCLGPQDGTAAHATNSVTARRLLLVGKW